jgi:hypothetical protein
MTAQIRQIVFNEDRAQLFRQRLKDTTNRNFHLYGYLIKHSVHENLI